MQLCRANGPSNNQRRGNDTIESVVAENYFFFRVDLSESRILPIARAIDSSREQVCRKGTKYSFGDPRSAPPRNPLGRGSRCLMINPTNK